MYLFSFLRTVICKNQLCFCCAVMPVEKQRSEDHMKLLKNRCSFSPVECNSCCWLKIAGQNLALQTCVIDFPSALSAVWETNQSSESAVHCPGTSWGWRIFQSSSQVVPQLRVMITLSQPTQGAFWHLLLMKPFTFSPAVGRGVAVTDAWGQGAEKMWEKGLQKRNRL